MLGLLRNNINNLNGIILPQGTKYLEQRNNGYIAVHEFAPKVWNFRFTVLVKSVKALWLKCQMA